MKIWERTAGLDPKGSNVAACLNQLSVRWCEQQSGAHESAGVGLVGCTQLHGAVQVQLQRLRSEAEHLKAVADGGTFPVSAELSGVVEEKGNRVVVCTAAEKERR